MHLVIQASPTEGAARAEPSLLELCRVASEEDEVNSQEFVRNLFFLVLERDVEGGDPPRK